MKKIFDISIDLSSDTVVWEGDPKMRISKPLKMEDGDAFNLSKVAMSIHTGTHIDVPYHFVQDGKQLQEISLDVLIGDAQVIEIPLEVQEIDKEILSRIWKYDHIERVLFKTKNSQFWSAYPSEFRKDFTYLTEDGSEFLIQKGVKLIGIDYLSISEPEDVIPVHELLMKNDIVILESIDLSDVDPGLYELFCLPLKLLNVEGAPCRAILIKD